MAEEESLLVRSWGVILSLALFSSALFFAFVLTAPKDFDPRNEVEITEDDFTNEDKTAAEKSGYAYYKKHRNADNVLKTNNTFHVVVLGDIGRSPRMQYHALSIAAHGGLVNLIGYVESEVHPDIQANSMIKVIAIPPVPTSLRTANKLLFLIVGPLKVLWQVLSLYIALGYRTTPAKWMIVQNPPSIPTLAVAQFVCFFRNTRLVIDWHNFGYSLLALKLGKGHPLVRISDWYEYLFCHAAENHLAVTDAMTRALQYRYGIRAVALHDRPPKYFQPLSPSGRSAALQRLSDTAQYATEIKKEAWRLIVSSTSWTPDEDFSVLLDALVAYSSALSSKSTLPKILAIITGKGPEKQHYLDKISVLNQEKKLQNVVITTAWLSNADYASLLASADLGISLHTSSSGVDLPMKVVDMFGTGLPVAGWSKFEAWPELVKEGVNGRGFDSAEGLTKILTELFGRDGEELQKLRQGAMEECSRRWDDEWMPVAGKLFKLD